MGAIIYPFELFHIEQSMIANLFSHEMLVLFAILAIGSWIGHFSWRGISLGSAGVLFVAMAFGHFGMQTPREAMELGLLLFVYRRYRVR